MLVATAPSIFRARLSRMEINATELFQVSGLMTLLPEAMQLTMTQLNMGSGTDDPIGATRL